MPRRRCDPTRHVARIDAGARVQRADAPVSVHGHLKACGAGLVSKASKVRFQEGKGPGGVARELICYDPGGKTKMRKCAVRQKRREGERLCPNQGKIAAPDGFSIIPDLCHYDNSYITSGVRRELFLGLTYTMAIFQAQVLREAVLGNLGDLSALAAEAMEPMWSDSQTRTQYVFDGFEAAVRMPKPP